VCSFGVSDIQRLQSGLSGLRDLDPDESNRRRFVWAVDADQGRFCRVIDRVRASPWTLPRAAGIIGRLDVQTMTKADTAVVPLPQPHHQIEPAPPTGSAKRRWFWIVWLLVLCLVAGLALLIVVRVRAGLGAAAANLRDATGGRGIPVDAATARIGDLPVHVDGLLGTVTPLQTVTVHTRVDGELIKVAFEEGQIVRQGDLLAQIDPNPYKAMLEQAQGQLAKDQALLKDAQLDLNRFKQAPDAYTAQQIDTQTALVEQDKGIVRSDQGAVDSAQVNLNYCTINSPITGRIGLRLVDQGNIVHAADATGLAVITQLQPITVVFPIQQDAIPDVITRSDHVPPLPTTALNGDQVLARGKLIAIDSQVNTTTGTVNLKAQFDNTRNELFPNQLVTVKLLVNTLRNVVLVPSEAVQTGPDFSFVYVAKPDNTVEIRKIKPGADQEVNGADMTAVDEGLSAGELVVTNGVDKLEAGSKVVVTRVGATTRPTTRTSTTRPGGRSHRSTTGDSTPQASPRNSE
jgi:multidrug efflux system membrane fusion protein